MGGLAVGKGEQKQPSWEPSHTAPAQTAGGEDSSGMPPGSSLEPSPVPESERLRIRTSLLDSLSLIHDNSSGSHCNKNDLKA